MGSSKNFHQSQIKKTEVPHEQSAGWGDELHEETLYYNAPEPELNRNNWETQQYESSAATSESAANKSYSTPQEKKRHLEIEGTVNDVASSITAFDDRRTGLVRLLATLFRGVPYGTYVGAIPEADGRKRRTAWQMTVNRDNGQPETVMIYGFMTQAPKAGRYRVVGVRNAEGAIEAEKLYCHNSKQWCAYAIEQTSARLIRLIALLMVLIPAALIAAGIAHNGSIGTFFHESGNYLLLYTVAVLLAVLYIWIRIRQRRWYRANRRRGRF